MVWLKQQKHNLKRQKKRVNLYASFERYGREGKCDTQRELVVWWTRMEELERKRKKKSEMNYEWKHAWIKRDTTKKKNNILIWCSEGFALFWNSEIPMYPIWIIFKSVFIRQFCVSTIKTYGGNVCASFSATVPCKPMRYVAMRCASAHANLYNENLHNDRWCLDDAKRQVCAYSLGTEIDREWNSQERENVVL